MDGFNRFPYPNGGDDSSTIELDSDSDDSRDNHTNGRRRLRPYRIEFVPDDSEEDSDER